MDKDYAIFFSSSLFRSTFQMLHRLNEAAGMEFVISHCSKEEEEKKTCNDRGEKKYIDHVYFSPSFFRFRFRFLLCFFFVRCRHFFFSLPWCIQTRFNINYKRIFLLFITYVCQCLMTCSSSFYQQAYR